MMPHPTEPRLNQHMNHIQSCNPKLHQHKLLTPCHYKLQLNPSWTRTLQITTSWTTSKLELNMDTHMNHLCVTHTEPHLNHVNLSHNKLHPHLHLTLNQMSTCDTNLSHYWTTLTQIWTTTEPLLNQSWPTSLRPLHSEPNLNHHHATSESYTLKPHTLTTTGRTPSQTLHHNQSNYTQLSYNWTIAKPIAEPKPSALRWHHSELLHNRLRALHTKLYRSWTN